MSKFKVMQDGNVVSAHDSHAEALTFIGYYEDMDRHRDDFEADTYSIKYTGKPEVMTAVNPVRAAMTASGSSACKWEWGTLKTAKGEELCLFVSDVWGNDLYRIIPEEEVAA